MEHVSWWKRPAILAAALAALVVLVYAPVRHFAFVNWDDPQYITANPRVPGGLAWANVVWALMTGYTPYWHPLTWLSHMTDVQFFGLDAGPHHVTSLLFHLPPLGGVATAVVLAAGGGVARASRRLGGQPDALAAHRGGDRG
jgi:hypothetical protein